MEEITEHTIAQEIINLIENSDKRMWYYRINKDLLTRLDVNLIISIITGEKGYKAELQDDLIKGWK